MANPPLPSLGIKARKWFTTCGKISWENRTVILVGGGTSLEHFDFSRIQGKGVIVGINDSAFREEVSADVCHSLDVTWASRRKKEYKAFADAGGEVVLAVPTNFEWDLHGREGITYVVRERHSALIDNGKALCGINSGYSAINLAFVRKAARVFLLGFDMHPGELKTHWHGGYPWHSRRNHKFYGRWCQAYGQASEQLARAGIKVYNVGLTSQLSCFEKVPLDLLEDYL